MEEGGSRKQVTKIKVIVFKSCILVRLNVPVAVRLLNLNIVEPTPRAILLEETEKKSQPRNWFGE